MRKLKSNRGIALIFVMIILIVLAGLAAFASNFYYNKRLLETNVSGDNIKTYYLAMAGVVNAHWRIRTDNTAGLVPAGSFATDNYDPGAYDLDVDLDSVNDVSVDIGTANAVTKERTIVSTGIDV